MRRSGSNAECVRDAAIKPPPTRVVVLCVATAQCQRVELSASDRSRSLELRGGNWFAYGEIRATTTTTTTPAARSTTSSQSASSSVGDRAENAVSVS